MSILDTLVAHGQHRLTKAGLKQALRDEKATSARLADQLANERQQHAEERTRSELTAQREIRRLAAANRAWEARYANEHPVSVPAPRDLTGGVLPLWDALQPTPVTDPGQTSWGARNEQQEVA